MTARVIHGDCLQAMRRLAGEGVLVDSIVTDPPYGLGFMGKSWDKFESADMPMRRNAAMDAVNAGPSRQGGRQRACADYQLRQARDMRTYQAWCEEWAEAAFTLMKPGAHLVAFGGSRTFHRVACAIEDAGLEIRDTIMWVYGQGFPKSLDVSKAIDKAAGAEREVIGVRPGHEDFVGRTDAHSAGARREGWDRPWKADPDKVKAHHLATAPATDAARQWQGWGSALKPAHEPIIWATRPLTVVPPCGLLAEVSISIEGLIWSLSSAKTAELLSRSSQSESAEAYGSVRLLAALIASLSSHGASDVMATFSSPEAGSTSLSIALLWNAILDASSQRASMFTTGTVSSLTTGLRTLNSWILATTPESITQAATNLDGLWCNASNAAETFSDWRSLFGRIHRPSVTGHALTATASAILRELASIAVRSSVLPPATVDAIVRQLAPTESARPISASDGSTFALNVAALLRLTPPELQSIAGESAWRQHIESHLRPNGEPIILARKPLDGTVAANVLRHGTGAINIDGCRVETAENLNGGAYSGALRQRAEYTSADSVDGAVPLSRLNRGAGEYQQPAGRWPANVCHDGSPEVLEAFARFGESKGQAGSVSGNEPSECHSGVYSGPRGRVPFAARNDTGTAARFFYCSKASAADRAGSKHPTVKPLSLMRWLCRLVTPPGGLILDPFAGSGTTLQAATEEGFRAIGIEQEAEYVADIERRLAKVQHDAGLFAA